MSTLAATGGLRLGGLLANADVAIVAAHAVPDLDAKRLQSRVALSLWLLPYPSVIQY